jgi:hypothetical protein
VIWHEEEGGRDPCCGFWRFGEAEELTTGSEPQEEFGEADCEEEEWGACWNHDFLLFFLYFSDAKQFKGAVGVALTLRLVNIIVKTCFLPS